MPHRVVGAASGSVLSGWSFDKQCGRFSIASYWCDHRRGLRPRVQERFGVSVLGYCRRGGRLYRRRGGCTDHHAADQKTLWLPAAVAFVTSECRMSSPDEGKANKRIVLGISGASGVGYARRVMELLDDADCQTHVIVTGPARNILQRELAISDLSPTAFLGRAAANVTFHDNADLADPLASGSHRTDAMIVCPCSSHSVAAIAAGLADTLLLRSAYVALKQRRPLILVHRETPLTAIDLENMLKISRAGGVICPAAPAFYMQPKRVDDLIDSIAGRVLDLLHVPHDLPVRWQER